MYPLATIARARQLDIPTFHKPGACGLCVDNAINKRKSEANCRISYRAFTYVSHHRDRTCFHALRYRYIARGNPRSREICFALPSFLQIAACALLQLPQLRFSAMLVTDRLPRLFPLIDPCCIFHVILPRAAATARTNRNSTVCVRALLFPGTLVRERIRGKFDSRTLFRSRMRCNLKMRPARYPAILISPALQRNKMITRSTHSNIGPFIVFSMSLRRFHSTREQDSVDGADMSGDGGERIGDTET